MKLTVLLDNNTYIDRYYLGEPGVSYLIEDSGQKVLFDVGYSNAFLVNANKMGETLLDLDFIALSHGHIDHTWGLTELAKLYIESLTENFFRKKGELVERQIKIPKIIAHPLTFLSKRGSFLGEIGSIFSEEKLLRHFEIKKTTEPVWITEKLVWLGQIPRENNFENQSPVGKVNTPEGDEIRDFLVEDTAFAYIGSEGLFVISACSHPGICNIIEYAKKVTGEERIYDVIGGFHLQDPSEEQLAKTVEYFNKIKPKQIHACHCTDLRSKIELSKVGNLQEVGVGLTIQYK